MTKQIISLVSNTSEKYEIEEDKVRSCKLISTIIEMNNDNEDIVIPLPNINTEILEIVIKFLNMPGSDSIEIDKPLRKNFKNCIGSEFVNFIESYKTDTILEIIKAANYIDCKTLLDLGCSKIAALISGKSPEQIKNILSIED